MSDKTPVYNLKVAIKETGLTPATLRAWERRYGLIKPYRSPGGHRLYTREDIEMLKWLVARQGEGLTISRAVELWKARSPEVNRVSKEVPGDEETPITGESQLEKLRQRWISACLVFDDQAANQALDQAFAIAAPETVCIEVLKKGLAEVGTGWYSGTFNVQQEHFASAITIRRLNALLASAQSPHRPQTILAVCPIGEEHDFILLMATYLLRRRGWKVLYLGSNVPLENLGTTVDSARPALVLSAAQTLPSAASLRNLSQMLHEKGIPLAYGGGIFSLVPAATRHISGYYLGTDFDMLAKIVEILVVAPPEEPVAIPVTAEYVQTLASFRLHTLSILAQVAYDTQGLGIDTSHLGYAMDYLTSNITSALALGDTHLMDYMIDWVDVLLEHHGLRASISRQYYLVYRRAVEKYLADEGKIILEWFDQITAHQS